MIPSFMTFFDDSRDDFSVTFFECKGGDGERLHDFFIYPPAPEGGSESARRMGTFYELPDGGVCFWTVCMYGVGQHPLLTCHGPAMNDVGEAGYFFGGEVPCVTI
jgi:hypothetical protein